MGQLESSPEYERFLHSEFPAQMEENQDPISRRRFMNLMGASAALAGLAACSKPVEKIVPYVKPPEEVIPGVAEYYATTMPFGLSPVGLLVKSVDGRPIKIEGNEQHPSSMGGTHAFAQAEILNLYDPDRSQYVMQKGVKSTWGDFLNAWRELYPKYTHNRGKGLAILSPSLASPTLKRLQTQYKRNFPDARWYIYDAIPDHRLAAAGTVFGESLVPVYDLSKADVILSLDADILMMDADSVANIRAFSSRRNPDDESAPLNRLYAVEGAYSVTGSNADHRLPLPTSQIGAFTLALAHALGELGVNIDAKLSGAGATEFDPDFIHALTRDLVKNKGRCLVAAGQQQPEAVHALVYAINAALGNIGNTLQFYPADDRITTADGGVDDLRRACDAGRIETLVMPGGNPVYDAPADMDFMESLIKIAHTINFSLHMDETSQNVEWHVPATHFLESWGDTIDPRNLRSIVQPLILPLYDDVHSVTELLNLVVTGRDDKDYDIVRETWKNIITTKNFEDGWQQVLHDGLLTGTVKPANVNINAATLQKLVSAVDVNPVNGMELVFVPSPTTWDGRYVNNGWLQELPHPMTKIAWNNPLLLAPATAKSLNVKDGDHVKVKLGDSSIELPVCILPGMDENTVAVTPGYGRKGIGRISNKVGTNVYPLRSGVSLYTARVELARSGKKTKLANTQDHGSMEGRPIVRETDLPDYKKDPRFAAELVEHPPLKNLWKEHKYDTGYQWGMIIDLNKCIGCNACVAACQSENNIPIVGVEQVRNGREMHWIRLDRYFEGGVTNPKVVHQPMTCHHCENAPCEQVCPVAATVHDKEGLNLMTYNRCVGTRYCSNNCPYKVRRFNFFNYHKHMTEQDKLVQNPDVTVRSRGVMEKCTFCLQRINAAKSEARKTRRELKPNEVRTACQQVCPANAISFGNILDPESEVTKLRDNPRAYTLLEELNNRPRLLYLAKVRNPNPDLVQETEHKENHA